jgi:hypothetical protein
MAAIDLYLVLLVSERSSVTRLILLSAAWTISLWTNNMMAIYLAGLGIGWLVLPGNRSLKGRICDALFVSIVAALAFSPWLPTMLAQTRRIRGGFWPSTPDGWQLASTIGMLFGINQQGLMGMDLRGFLAVDFAIGGLGLFACISSTGRRYAIALFSFGVLPILLIFFYSRVGQSIFTERAFLASGVALPLLATLPIEAARINRKLSMVIVCGLLVLTVKSLPDHRLGEHPESWRQACAYVQTTTPHHRLVICVASDGEPLYRYYACHRNYGPMTDVTAVPASFFALDPPRTLQQVKSDSDLDALRRQLTAGNYDEVDLIASHTWWGDHTERTLELLNSEMNQTDQKVFNGITVFRFGPAQ